MNKIHGVFWWFHKFHAVSLGVYIIWNKLTVHFEDFRFIGRKEKKKIVIIEKKEFFFHSNSEIDSN